MKKADTFIWLGIIASLLGLYFSRTSVINLGYEIMAKLTRSQFIEKFGPIAKIASRNTTLFPSVFMAQAILESSNGNSSLTRQANNFFGIKADPNWPGPFISKETTEYIDGVPKKVIAKFRAYETAIDSFLDRVNFLYKNARYRNAGVFSAISPEDQAKALQRAGYATDPEYANLLIKLINQNNLKKFDI